MRLSRQIWVVLHRWAGLTIALFLTVAGLTGSLLAFMHELEPFAAPAVFKAAPPAPGAAPLDPLDLRDMALRRYPGAVINYLPLQAEPDRAFKLIIERPDPATGALRPYADDWDELFVDPYTGEEKGRRKWGNIGEGPVNLFPFLYRLHYSLALGGAGEIALGLAALIWTLDCLVGFYLTLPVRTRRREAREDGRRGWLSRWRPAWLVRWRSSSYKITLDLHRAGGLWIWPLLFVFAWSAVALNLPQAYNPVMRLIGYQPIAEGIIPPQTGEGGPGKDFRAALRRGETLAEQIARAEGVALDEAGPAVLRYYYEYGVYLYRFTSEASVARRSYGDSMVIFSARTGEALKTVLPRKESAGNAANAWLEALHLAAVWGLPWRIAVSLLGVMVTMLSVTGVLIWMKKRSARLARRS